MTEIWKNINDYERYEVSNLGRIRSLNSKTYGYILKPTRNGTGRLTVKLYDYVTKSKKTHLVHLLVMSNFKGPRPEGMECCHDDGNPLNNHINNLRWDTHLNNIRDKYRHGTMLVGSQKNNALLTEDKVKEIKKLIAHGGQTCVSIAKTFKVKPSTIYNISGGRSWKHVT